MSSIGLDRKDIDRVSLQNIKHCTKMSRDDIFERVYESGVYVVAWGKIYHKITFQNLRFEFGRICEDEFIFHKIYAQVEYICWIDHALYAYRQSTNSIMRTNGVWHAHPDAIDAFLERLSFFQQYGNTRFIKNTEDVILGILPDFAGQMEDAELKKLIVRTGQEIYRITGKRVVSLKFMLFKLSPKIYLWLRKYYRVVKAALLKDSMV